MTIVNRVKSRIWILEDRLKIAWIDEINNAQQRDFAKAQQQGQQLNRTMTQTRPMMRPLSPLSPTFQGGPPPPQGYNGGPVSPQFPGGPRPRPPMMGGRPPMMGGPMGGPGFRPQMGPGGPGGPMGGPGMGPGGPGGHMGRPGMGPRPSMNGRPGPRPFNRAMVKN